MSLWTRLFGGKRKVEDASRKASSSRAPSSSAEEAYNRGVDCMHKGDWETARGHLLKATKLVPEYAPGWYALGLTYPKTAPEGANEQDLLMHLREMCSSFERAIDSSDLHGELKPENYRFACLASARIYKIDKQYDRAIHALRRGLEKAPGDIELLEGIAYVLFEKGELEQAEQAVVELLDARPDSENWRKLWKKIRRGAGKSLTVDLSEKKRKAIYGSYQYKIEDKLYVKSDVEEGIRKATDIEQGLQAAKVMQAAVKRAKEEAEKEILESHEISAFELHMIIEEGKRNAWRAPSITDLAREHPRPPEASFRDSLNCLSCWKHNYVPFWPDGGDITPFYAQSEETTREQPGEFRLPVECPVCSNTWFVVWDIAPDPIARLLVWHIERMCQDHASNAKAVKTLRGIIVDGILGEHVKFIKENLKNAVEDRQTVEQSTTYEEYFSTLTIVPALEPAAVRRCLGGIYFEYMERILAEADMDHRNTVHWIFAWGGENVAVHMLFLPKRSAFGRLPKIFPIDLLTPQERSHIGL